MDKKNIIKILEEIATILELKGENPFKSRAYLNAARTLETLNEDLNEPVLSGRITELSEIVFFHRQYIAGRQPVP